MRCGSDEAEPWRNLQEQPRILHLNFVHTFTTDRLYIDTVPMAIYGDPSVGNEPVAEDQDYVYSPLPPGEHFRSLALQPGSGDDPLRCDIRVSAISDGNYEAISYVWGSEVRDCRVYCEDRTMWITANLFEALKRLRDSIKVRRLWADSICIDQDNVREKEHQVANMGQIYGCASRVILFMGSDPNDHGPRLASLLNDVQTMFKREIGHFKSLSWDCFPDVHKDSNHPLLLDERWSSYKALSKQDWFRRGWVVREAGLAKEGVIVWGDGEIPWKDLMYTILWIYGKRVNITFFRDRPSDRLPNEFVLYLQTYWDRNHPVMRMFFEPLPLVPARLLDYLARGRHLQFKDRRDSIYAFLDLALESSGRLEMVPDYTQSPIEVFNNFATNYIKTTGDTSILSYVIHDSEGLSNDLPTWVPRWEALDTERDDHFWKYVSYFLLDGDYLHMPVVTDTNILRVYGFVLDELQFVSDVLREPSTTPQLLLRLYQTAKASTASKHSHRQFSMTEFVEAVARAGLQLFDQKEYRQCLTAYVNRMESLDEGTEQQIDQETSRRVGLLHDAIRSISNAKRLMITKCGHIGLAPAQARQNDVCVSLLGSKCLPWPYLLRPTEEPHHYNFVGPAWTVYEMKPSHAENDMKVEQPVLRVVEHAGDNGEIRGKQILYIR